MVHQIILQPVRDICLRPFSGQIAVDHGFKKRLQNYLMNHPDYMRLYSIAGGNEQLVQRLLQ
ncbi:MAG: hypothetical protein ACKPJD_20950, partial [Planctomycetaceae bacterium]